VANPYESKKLLSEYLFFHYALEQEMQGLLPGDALQFPLRCVRELIDPSALPLHSRALDLGCSVGRSSFELSRFCENVIGIDLSRSFIQAAQRLQEQGVVRFEIPVEGDIGALMEARVPEELDRNRVRFRVADAMNLPPGLGTFDLLFAANLICRLPQPRRFLEHLSELANPGGQLLLTTPFTWLEEFTARPEWLGGRKEEGLRSAEAVAKILEPHFELQLTRNLPFLIREHERKHQYGIALGWRWVRR
jgi:putative 4-mercaptohistidine N1-methyltranferase